MVKFLDPKGETWTRGSPYKFSMLNSPELSHRGKNIISPNWWNQLWWKLWFWNRDRWGYLSENFQTYRSSNFRDITETISGIYAEEIGKLGLPVSEASLHCFKKRRTLDSSTWRGLYFYPIISERFQILKIRVSLTNPRSASSATRMDTSNW